MFGIADQNDQLAGGTTPSQQSFGDPASASTTTSPLLNDALSQDTLKDDAPATHPITGAPMPPAEPTSSSLEETTSTPLSAAATSTSTPAPSSSPTSSDDLLDIKQQALQQLSPLVDQLEQSPEEKFKTTMMMLQATDDQSMVKTAYDLANAIEDEKTRAQALLDVVNEINYFTQAKKD